MNSLFTNNISLDHGTHTYQLLDDPEFRFASVTEFIHEFFRKFDQEKTAKKLAENRVNIQRAKLAAINSPVYQ